MTPEVKEFCDRVDRLEERYKGANYKHVDQYQMPRELMVKLRDELRAPSLPMESEEDK